MKKVRVLDHPLAKEQLGILRNQDTGIQAFRKASDTLSMLLLCEATKFLQTKTYSISTPLAKTEIEKREDTIVFLPILRAGLALLPTALSLFPDARVGMIGLRRNEETAEATEYYSHIPDLSDAHVFVLDPMLATGGSMLHLLRTIKSSETVSLNLVTVIAVPEGIEAVRHEFEDVEIVTTAIDEKLNDQKFIVPGLGDYGDRYFGTT